MYIYIYIYINTYIYITVPQSTVRLKKQLKNIKKLN